MKIQSAEKRTVNYPLKKELTPLLLGIALSVSGHAADTIHMDMNDTETDLIKIVMGQLSATPYTNGKFDINDTNLPCKTEPLSPVFDGVLIAGKIPMKTDYTFEGQVTSFVNDVTRTESTVLFEGVLIQNTDVNFFDSSLSTNTPERVIGRGFQKASPCKMTLPDSLFDGVLIATKMDYSFEGKITSFVNDMTCKESVPVGYSSSKDKFNKPKRLKARYIF